MKPENNRNRGLMAALLAITMTGPAAAFELDSDIPIKVTADNARLDDGQGIATYTGDVELEQGETHLSAERVVLYRDENGLNRIEAFGNPARYRQPSREGEGEGETDARALNITWSAADQRLIFERQAVIEQNGNLFRGDIIHYDTARRVVTAQGGADSGEGSGRVEMVIQPRSTDRRTDRQESDGSSEGQ